MTREHCMLLAHLLLVVFLTRPTAAQIPDTTHFTNAASLSGVVHDSTSHQPLIGAVVQLVVADDPAKLIRAAVSDSLGRFSLPDLPAGRYKLGFFHPILDSLGVELPPREVYVAHDPIRVDLAIPAPPRLRTAICGPQAGANSIGLVVGVVRNAGGSSPAGGVTVTAQWLEFSFTREGILRRARRLVATTADNGWFAICDAPRGGTMGLIASRGTDSTDLIEVHIPEDGFLRYTMYLGAAPTVGPREAPQTVDPLDHTRRAVRLGDGLLSGTVVAAVGNDPLNGAQISMVDGPETRTNERGEWSLTEVPTGTRMLEVRALGYYPQRRPVNVVVGAAPIHFTLFALETTLDTVVVSSSRIIDRHGSGFELRRRSGAGRYLSLEDIARWSPIFTSHIFRTVPGVKVDIHIKIRGAFGDCEPALYINGIHARPPPEGLTADYVDMLLSPSEIGAVEIYYGSIPPQFQQALSGCGSIVIWTK